MGKIQEEINNYVDYILSYSLNSHSAKWYDNCIDILFFLTQIMHDDEKKMDQNVSNAISNLIFAINQYPKKCLSYFDTGMYSKLGLLAFSIRELNKIVDGLQETSKLLNKVILNNNYRKIQRFQQSKLTFSDYDILGGVSGVVYYLLDCQDILEDSKDMLTMRELIRYLIYLAKDYTYKGNRVIRYHIRKKQQFLQKERAQMKLGHINFGTAHGIAGPMVTLAKAKWRGILEQELDESIERLRELYRRFCVELESDVLFPRRLAVESFVTGKSTDLTENSGWCYGNLGIIRNLMKTSRYMEDESMYQFYLNKFIDLIDREEVEYNLDSPIICHGFAGIISTQVYAFKESKDEKCLVNIKRNLERTLIEHQKKERDSENYINNFSFLDGSTGAILAMQNSLTLNLSFGKILLVD